MTSKTTTSPAVAAAYEARRAAKAQEKADLDAKKRADAIYTLLCAIEEQEKLFDKAGATSTQWGDLDCDRERLARLESDGDPEAGDPVAKVAAIQGRVAAVKSAPWISDGTCAVLSYDAERDLEDREGIADVWGPNQSNAALIAHAPEDLAWCLARIAELEAQVAGLPADKDEPEDTSHPGWAKELCAYDGCPDLVSSVAVGNKATGRPTRYLCDSHPTAEMIAAAPPPYKPTPRASTKTKSAPAQETAAGFAPPEF